MASRIRLLSWVAVAVAGLCLVGSFSQAIATTPAPRPKAEQRLTCLRLADARLAASMRHFAKGPCPEGSVLVALDDAATANAPPGNGPGAALVPGGATVANGNDDRFCLGQAKRAGGGVSAIRLHGSDTACPPGFTLAKMAAPMAAGATAPNGPGDAQSGLAREARSGLGRQALCLPTASGVGPGFRLLSDRCPAGFVRFSADNPAAMGVSFAGVTGGGRINCLLVTTPRRARELGLPSAAGCPSGSIALEDDNPTSVGHQATAEGQRTGQTAQAGQDYCLPARNGLGRGFPLSAALPGGLRARDGRIHRHRPGLIRAAPEAAER